MIVLNSMFHRILETIQRSAPRAKSMAHIPVVMVLFAAGLLKVFQLASTPDDVNFVFGSKWFTILLFEYELALGGWLIWGAYCRQARVVALTTFVGFAIVSATKVMAGEENCDCFGTIRVHPSISVAINLIAIGLLTLWDVPRTAIRHAVNWKFKSSLALMALALLPIFMFQVSSLDAQGNIIGDSKLVVLEPDSWVGKPFPVQDYIEYSSQLMQGKWQVVVYDEHCGKCQDLIRAASTSPPKIRTAFIEIPPYGTPAQPSNPGLVWLRLCDDRDWFVETPATLTLEQGIVTSFTPQSY